MGRQLSTSRGTRGGLSVLAAVVASLAIAGQGLGATWGNRIALTSRTAADGGLAAVGESTAIVAYSSAAGTFLRRSTDSGVTWGKPIELSNVEGDVAIAARGQNVDVVWAEGASLRYAQSADGGLTFAPSVALRSICGFCFFDSLSIARGSNGVVVGWIESDFEAAERFGYVTVSGDGGESFREPMPLGFGREVRVAAGRGVVYVAYQDFYSGCAACDGPLFVRRSFDAGLNWRAATLMANVGFGTAIAITAVRDVAYVAWTAVRLVGEFGESEQTWIRYRRTTDRGATWSSRTGLTSRESRTWLPVIDLKEGVVRILFHDFDDGGVFYRKSADGSHWSRRERVATSGLPTSVAFAGRAMALYRNETGTYLRLRAP